MAFDIKRGELKGGYTKFALTMSAIIKTLRESGEYANIKKPTVCKELTGCINDELNSNVRVIIEPYLYQNANVQVPLLDKNNPLWREMLREYYADFLEERSLKDAYKASGDKLVGTVDVNGKLGGYFKEVESDIKVSLDLIYPQNGHNITPEGTAAIIFHEIGHFVNYLKALGWQARTNYVMLQAHNRLMGIGSVNKRVEIIEEITKKEGIKVEEDIEYLARTNNSNTVCTVLVGGCVKNIRSELGADIYDSRGFESLADNYAAHHGFGLDLVMALDGMTGMSVYRKRTIANTLSKVAALIWTIASVIPVVGVIHILVLACYRPDEKIYDDPADRYKRMARTMIDNLKDEKNVSRKDIERIEAIYNVADKYDNSREFYQAIYEFITPTGRKSRSLRELNQHLEELASSKLYLSANKLSAYA